jgi:hypothetical protein
VGSKEPLVGGEDDVDWTRRLADGSSLNFKAQPLGGEVDGTVGVLAGDGERDLTLLDEVDDMCMIRSCGDFADLGDDLVLNEDFGIAAKRAEGLVREYVAELVERR